MSSSGTEPSVSEADKLEGDDVAAAEAVPSKSEATGVDGCSAEEAGVAVGGKEEVEPVVTDNVGEKRPRVDGAVEDDSPSEEPPTKKAAAGDGEQQPCETEINADASADATGVKTIATPEGPTESDTSFTEGSASAPTTNPVTTHAEPVARPIGPAPPQDGADLHHWGADAGPFRHTVNVPQHCVAQIIGRGGANLMSTRNTTRCHIECDQHTKDNGYSLFHIDATSEEDLQRGVRAIERQTKPMHPLEGEVQQVVIVPDERVGDILGPRGCVVKVISDRTGCRIDIQQRGLQRGEPRECRIVGSPDEVQAGIRMVEGIRDGSVDVKAIIHDFELANPAFRREQEMRAAAAAGGGWMALGKGGGNNMWETPYGMRGPLMPQQASSYGVPAMVDQWSHLLPATGPMDRAVVDVPSDCAGLVIGRGGESIKALQADCSLSECQIEKGVDQRTPRKMTLQGPATGVQAAIMQLSMKTNGRIVTIVQQQYPNYQPQQQQQGPMMTMQQQQQPQQQGYTGMPPSREGYGMPGGMMMMQGGGSGGMDPMAAQYYSQWSAYQQQQQQMNVNNQQNAAAWRNYYAQMGNPQTPPYRGGGRQ
ncbi:hypothetical protein Pmar_PMAR029693 [Perkinsus marinus ATCC 50983]|uniref:K Homology domain-containing protein n=1 Tax=Perkinsus marinus (strain ATCC 50983 / TXsc) TaxID=423536 RepID=C5KQI0_PERM5|nr:hypothetical protein Pmar_PMAR029693 [Perkinsus marinus ATCC 50983]EER13256.1 hypothetical protein Pmar_PMAR029693 [Perkinsus marinus ATCC 50983]|eukprot:XP_002781461.1 hypothetical protein Pmar_PMAR029693 [Perkinsus marinus ATCC 50983]